MIYGSSYRSNIPPEEHMHCTFCGQQLKTDAKTCFRCGYDSPFQLLPYYQVSDPNHIGEFIEICEINWVRKAVGLTARIFFQAEVDGPEGKYIYATSEPAPDKYMYSTPEGSLRAYHIPENTPEAVAVFNQLITVLEEDGWEYRSRGLGWWNFRYQHALEPQSKPEQPRQAPNDTRRISEGWREAQ